MCEVFPKIANLLWNAKDPEEARSFMLFGNLRFKNKRDTTTRMMATRVSGGMTRFRRVWNVIHMWTKSCVGFNWAWLDESARVAKAEVRVGLVGPPSLVKHLGHEIADQDDTVDTGLCTVI